jgi:hypothetical protein
MDNQRNAGRPNQPGQGPPGQPFGQPPGTPPGMPPGAASPPYGQPPGASYNPPPGGPPPNQPPYSAPPSAPPSASPGTPPRAGAPYGSPPYGQAQPYGQPPSYGPTPTPGGPPGQAFPPGYQPGQPYPLQPQYAPPTQAAGTTAPQTAPAPRNRRRCIIPVPIIGVLIVAGNVAAVVHQATLSPAVTSLQFAHNFQNNKAVGVTDTFKSTDPDLYAIIKLNTTKGHPTVKVVWTVVSGTDANGQPVTGRAFGQAEKDATSTLIYAQVSRGSAPWAVGQYKAEVFLDGRLAKTAQFTVTA